MNFICTVCGQYADDGDFAEWIRLRCIDKMWEEENNGVAPHRCTDEEVIGLDGKESPRLPLGRSDT